MKEFLNFDNQKDVTLLYWVYGLINIILFGFLNAIYHIQSVENRGTGMVKESNFEMNIYWVGIFGVLLVYSTVTSLAHIITLFIRIKKPKSYLTKRYNKFNYNITLGLLLISGLGLVFNTQICFLIFAFSAILLSRFTSFDSLVNNYHQKDKK